MLKHLDTDVVAAVNALVDKGAHIALSLHELPLDAFVGAKNVKVWPEKEGRAAYLSAEITIGDGGRIDIYSTDLPSASKAEESHVLEVVS